MLKYYIRKLALLLIAGVGVALPMHAEAPLARRGVVRVELQPEAAAKVGRQAGQSGPEGSEALHRPSVALGYGSET